MGEARVSGQRYRLAICEDESDVREHVCSLCDEILAGEGIEHEVTPFASATQLDEALLAGRAFDLLVLDIQMEGTTGMELARLLRSRGDRTSVLFVTGRDDYLLEGYSVQPVGFLLKPVDRDALARSLMADWELNQRPRAVTLHVKGRIVNLPLTETRYVESFGHTVVAHVGGGQLSFRLTLSELERMLPADRFCRCHKSYLVNMGSIVDVGRSSIQLGSGESVPVGRAYREGLQRAFVRFLSG